MIYIEEGSVDGVWRVINEYEEVFCHFVCPRDSINFLGFVFNALMFSGVSPYAFDRYLERWSV